jgi:hypothetical protein
MEIGSFVLILVFSSLVVLYIVAPLMAPMRRLRKGESLQVSALKAERDRVVNALQELDFDHNLGKIPPEDYPIQRAALLQKGADILRQLDELSSVASPAGEVESRIEEAAAAGRADSVEPVFAPPSDEDLESMIAARRKEHKSKSAGFCPKCGKSVLVSDKFCPSCGKSLNA